MLPFNKEEVRRFISLYLVKIKEEDVEKLYGLTGGLPFYLQFIGRSSGYVGSVDEAINKFLQQEGGLFFKEELEKFTEKEKWIVVGLSGGQKTLTKLAEEVKEPATTVGRYLPELIEKEIVVRESRGTYELLDKMFGLWLRKNYWHEYNQ